MPSSSPGSSSSSTSASCRPHRRPRRNRRRRRSRLRLQEYGVSSASHHDHRSSETSVFLPENPCPPVHEYLVELRRLQAARMLSNQGYELLLDLLMLHSRWQHNEEMTRLEMCLLMRCGASHLIGDDSEGWSQEQWEQMSCIAMDEVGVRDMNETAEWIFGEYKPEGKWGSEGSGRQPPKPRKGEG